MKNTFIASVLAVAFATSSHAGGLTESAETVVVAPTTVTPTHALGGSINVELTENTAGKYVAATTLAVGIDVDGLAFGGATVESVDGATFELDEWFVGTHVGVATLSFGKQGDLMIGNDFEIVGGNTIADVADDHESLQVTVGGAAVMLGFADIKTDVADLENVQASYAFDVNSVALTTVADYNLNSEDWVIGGRADADLTDTVTASGLVTYASATELFGYEASVGYNITTVFVNGDDSDAFQNVGAGVATTLGGLDVYAEGSYNFDAEDTVFGAGVTFSF